MDTTPLAQRRCVRCEPGTPQLPPEAVDELHARVPAWEVTETDGHPALSRRFTFKGFMPGVELVNSVAAIAEAEGHHPDLCLGWGYVTVRLWTHAAGGLTENDF